ncbi:MAG: ABC transporter substrate-binding protein [Armatimonadota bacterium]
MRYRWIALAGALMIILAAAPTKAQRPDARTLVIGLNTDIPHFDSMRLAGLPNFGIVNQVTEQLVRIDQTGKIIPLLAESWAIAGGGTQWTLSLRRNVRFHDGSPFNAAAVKYNIERLLRISPVAVTFRAIDRIEVVDDATVRIVTKYPFAPMMNLLTYAPVVMSSPAAAEPAGLRYGTPQVGAVGTGPFRWVHHLPGQEIRLEANREYWGGAPRVDALVVRPFVEAGARVIALESGQIDVAFLTPPVEARRLEANRQFTIHRPESERIVMFILNNTWGPLRDRRVRQAIFYAIDRETIVSRLLAGAAIVARSSSPTLAFGYAPACTYNYDPSRAKSLLKNAGFPDGFTVKFHYPTGRFNAGDQVIEAVQANLAQVGIRMEVERMEFAAWFTMSRRPAESNPIQMSVASLGAAQLDAGLGIQSNFSSAAWPPRGFNGSFYKNDEVDRLVDEIERIMDEKKRRTLARLLQTMVCADVPMIFMYQERQVHAAKASVKGLEWDPTQVLLPAHKVTK